LTQFALLVAGSAIGVVAQTNPAPSASNPNPVVVSFELRQGHIIVPVRVNNSEPLWFMLDTGYSMTMIHPDSVEKAQLKPTGRHITIVGIAGEEEANVFEGAVLDVGGASYSPRRIASLPSENDRRRRRDGILGSGFFRRYVVEIDSRTKTLRLHEPKDFQYAGQGEIIPLHFRKDTPIAEASLSTSKERSIKGQFEIDIGCDGALCLGADFVAAHKLTEASTETRNRIRQGVGGDARIRSGELLQLQLGHLALDNPSANFFEEGSPVDRDLAGHIGWEGLRQFRVIFDYSRRQMILESYSAKSVPEHPTPKKNQD
jgi:hypothetical protein